MNINRRLKNIVEDRERRTRMGLCRERGCKRSSSEDAWCELHDPKGWDRSFVYFVLAASVRMLKIGTAVDVDKRLETLRASSPVKLMLHASIIGGVHVERWCHFHSFADRSHFEWFKWSARQKRLTELIIEHGKYAPALLCPRELTADRRRSNGRWSGLTSSPLPGKRSESSEYLEGAGRDVTPLGACACESCKRWIGGIS